MFQQMFAGERDARTEAGDYFQHAHMLRPTTRWCPDVTALRSASTRVVVGIGEESGGQLCDRMSRALAATRATTSASPRPRRVRHPSARSAAGGLSGRSPGDLSPRSECVS
ncbi:conserved hypothetical protein (plasmid) [Rhodococcus jostii RHA1]|uniref:Uncharacterized protein n=1 Tax=Rhodococcus jostii (strain RHA1) TaxID=101510 RepID=Q0RXY1_RHOJR|nr:conserved hypothetical protein [Rhodococcus jostii RHA1]